jgi:hypothetical protein
VLTRGRGRHGRRPSLPRRRPVDFGGEGSGGRAVRDVRLRTERGMASVPSLHPTRDPGCAGRLRGSRVCGRCTDDNRGNPREGEREDREGRARSVRALEMTRTSGEDADMRTAAADSAHPLHLGHDW